MTIFSRVLLLIVMAGVFVVSAHRTASASGMSGLHVSGNQILNASNQPVRLLGVNRSGTEYACIQGWGIFDGPSDAASLTAMQTWGINAVRVPLNEDCWLGINTINPYVGKPYRDAIIAYVTAIENAGMAVILDLHWAAPGTTLSNSQTPMPDSTHAAAFWTSVAQAFGLDNAVVFDLFNEPFPDNNQVTTAAWTCLRDGGVCPGVSFPAAGMQSLVNAIRGTGATNVIMSPGIAYANVLDQWLTYKPVDPNNNIVASWHTYANQYCSALSCWNSQIAPVAASVPVVTGEIGEADCAHGYIDSLMNWAATQIISYLAWEWDTYSCGGSPALISNYDGTPTAFGAGFKTHLLTLGGNPTPTPIPVASAWVNISPPSVSTNYNNPPFNYGFNTVVTDPSGTVYVGTNYQGLWKSTDHGATWSKVNTGAGGPLLNSGRVWSLALDPSGTLYATAGYGAGGVLKSTDGGVSWAQVLSFSQSNDVYTVSTDPYTPNHILVSFHGWWGNSSDSGIVESKDGGASWITHNPQTGWGTGNGIFFGDNSNTWILGTQNDGEWITQNAGSTWREFSQISMTHGATEALYHNPANGNLILADGTQILKSTDNGTTWTDIGDSSNGLPYATYETVIGDGTHLYTAPSFPDGGDNPQAHGPWYTMNENGGTTWAPYNSQTTCMNGQCNGPVMMAVDASNHIVYGVNWLGGAWKLQAGSSGTPVPTATATVTAIPTSTSVSTPTSTPVPTPTIAATATATTTPTSTPTSVPARTSTPTSTATGTPQPTTTPTAPVPCTTYALGGHTFQVCQIS